MQAHWESIYQKYSPQAVSWFSPHLDTSLSWITRAGDLKSLSILDVGGGASTLADDLVSGGCRSLTVLDISETAMQASRSRMGEQSKSVRWVRADITDIALPAAAYDVWHDRAVFHFMTTSQARHAYAAAMMRSLKPGGQAILGIFGPDGPRKCSGLEVAHYDAVSLAKELGPCFHCMESSLVTHTTPAGGPQQFLYCRFAFDAAPTLSPDSTLVGK